MSQTLSLYYERSIESDFNGDQLYVMKHQRRGAKTLNELDSSPFQRSLRKEIFVVVVFFILRSSVKLNYFLHELGLDGKGPHNSVLAFEGE